MRTHRLTSGRVGGEGYDPTANPTTTNPTIPEGAAIPMQAIRTDGPRSGRLDGHPGPVAISEAAPVGVAEHPLVLVEWHDAWFEVDETTPDQRRSDYPVRTVGFLIGEGPSVLSLAQEVLPDAEGFRAITHIPLPIVKRVVALDVATP